jgi:hypothetical protein
LLQGLIESNQPEENTDREGHESHRALGDRWVASLKLLQKACLLNRDADNTLLTLTQFLAHALAKFLAPVSKHCLQGKKQHRIALQRRRCAGGSIKTVILKIGKSKQTWQLEFSSVNEG